MFIKNIYFLEKDEERNLSKLIFYKKNYYVIKFI